MYDIEKIKEELKPINVVRYLGVRYRRSGKNIFILCPEHAERTGMADRHIGNCVLGNRFHNAYHCFGCGATGDCFKLIALLKGLDLKKDFYEVLETAAEACGGASLFELDNAEAPKQKKKRKKAVTQNLLSQSSLKAIGLSGTDFAYTCSECFDRNGDSDTDCLIKDIDFSRTDPLGFPETSYLRTKELAYPLSQLASEDPEAYEWLIKSKAGSAMENSKRLAQTDWAGKLAGVRLSDEAEARCFSEETEDYFKAKFLEAENVWKGYATEDELEELDDGWVFGYDAPQEKEIGMLL